MFLALNMEALWERRKAWELRRPVLRETAAIVVCCERDLQFIFTDCVAIATHA